MLRKLPLYLALLLLTQCSKCKNDPRPVDPVSQLPPATQTGANTFGCLVNGQPYTPSGYDGTPNYAVLYDPGFQGGNLDVSSYRYPEKRGSNQQGVGFGGTNIDRAGIYRLGVSSQIGVGYFDEYQVAPCNEYRSDGIGTFSKGSITITRLDLQAGILSGTFEFVLAKPGCDTIKVTQGRFDKKL